MSNWTNLSFEELKITTKSNIIKTIGKYLDNLTKKQIIELLLDNVEISDSPTIEKYPDGQLKKRKVIKCDVLGNKLRTEIITWTYYGTGEVDIILIRELDANDNEIKCQRIRHFLDGCQPQLIEEI